MEVRDFVTYGLALKLEAKGFDNDFNYGYNDKGDICVPVYNIDEDQLMTMTPCPEIHEVLKWLREKKNIEVVASFSYRDRVWGYQVGDMTLSEDSILAYDYSFPTYEEAALAGIEYVINNLI